MQDLFAYWKRDPPWPAVLKHFLGAAGEEASSRPGGSSSDRLSIPEPPKNEQGQYDAAALQAIVAQLNGGR